MCTQYARAVRAVRTVRAARAVQWQCWAGLKGVLSLTPGEVGEERSWLEVGGLDVSAVEFRGFWCFGRVPLEALRQMAVSKGVRRAF